MIMKGANCQTVTSERRSVVHLKVKAKVYAVPFLGAFAKLRKATVSFVVCVCPSTWNSSVPTEQIFMKFDN